MSRNVVSAVRLDATRAGEVLVVDASENVLRGLGKLFRDAGLVVSSVGDLERARDQLSNRFFSVALIDLDTPTPGAGLDLLPFIKAQSPLTSPLVMTGRPTFEAVAAAFRAGAADVIPKNKESVPYLRDRVTAAAAEVRTTVNQDRLLAEIAEVHEQFLKAMMDLSRRATDLEDRLLSADRDDTTAIEELAGPLTLFVVDDNPDLPDLFEKALAKNKSWRLRVLQSGGEALDAATHAPPHVLVIKSTLPDLPGTMVVNTLKATAPEIVALLFTPPSESSSGEVRLMEGSRLTTVIGSFTDPEQLLSSLEEVRQALRKKVKERRYMQVFRKEHFEFLKRYNLVRQRLLQNKPSG